MKSSDQFDSEWMAILAQAAELSLSSGSGIRNLGAIRSARIQFDIKQENQRQTSTEM